MAAKKKTDPAPEDESAEDAPKATPVGPGEPVEADAVTQSGSTFAERAKAREAAEKRVTGASSENKAVKSAEAKKKA